MSKPKPDDDEIPPALKLLHKVWPPKPDPIGRTIGRALRGNKNAKEQFTDAAAEKLGKARDAVTDVVTNTAEMAETIRKKYSARQDKKNPNP